MFNKFEHLYIHWPFCKSKCYYCDFLSFANNEEFQKKYHDTLISQLKNFKNIVSLKTIFIGGGTPSIYPLDLLKELFEQLKKSFDFSHIKEITIEANPRDITEEKLNTWREVGINRLSIGVQVLDDDILAKVGRNQSVKDVFNAIKIAPKYFDNISVDLILGLPEISKKSWQKTLQEVVSWPINHVSCYILTQYKGTRLDSMIKKREIYLQKDDRIISLYQETVDFLREHEFIQYETSNFSKKGFESIHNIAYWDRKTYLGLGLGASSFDGQNRFINEKKILNFFNLTQDPLKGSKREVLSGQQEFIEFLMLSLRQAKGGGLHRMLYFLGSDEKIRFLDKLENLKKLGLIRINGGRVYLTLRGMLLENEVILRLL
ncbi:MAG: radical SAM family heme chaperone HemW [bacterium]